ncbi:MAG: hypothetical protein JXA57_14430 [Armatimonadetes bacterium]|nr:hypothetical protein [Armatimonadota bacterium]
MKNTDAVALNHPVAGHHLTPDAEPQSSAPARSLDRFAATLAAIIARHVALGEGNLREPGTTPPEPESGPSRPDAPQETGSHGPMQLPIQGSQG